jgi:hypothetical protein
MSTQTGIRANDELNQFFAKCKDVESRSRYRMIKVVISNEELTLELSKETVGDWKQDWDKMVLRSIDNDEPCYLLYRYTNSRGRLSNAGNLISAKIKFFVLSLKSPLLFASNIVIFISD